MNIVDPTCAYVSPMRVSSCARLAHDDFICLIIICFLISLLFVRARNYEKKFPLVHGKDLHIQMFSYLSTRTQTKYRIIRSDFMALVPRSSCWRIYLSPTIFPCPRHEDNLVFGNVFVPCFCYFYRIMHLCQFFSSPQC